MSQPTKSSGQAVILPNRAPSTRAKKTLRIELNSRDRNYLNLIKSNPFKYDLQTPIRDVQSVELLGGTIPAKPYTFNEYNNSFTFFEEHGGNRTIKLPIGVYDVETLTIELAALLSEGSRSLYEVSKNVMGRLLIVQKNYKQPFALLFASGSSPDVIDRVTGGFIEMNTPASILGFDLSDYTSIQGILLSPYQIDLYTTNTRLYLYLNFQNSQDLGCIQRGVGRRSPFAIIYLDGDTNGYKFLNKETFSPISYSLPQPISKLQSIHIEFRDEFHRLVDFNGKDFTLLLELTALE
jgi:hypothetical protein